MMQCGYQRKTRLLGDSNKEWFDRRILRTLSDFLPAVQMINFCCTRAVERPETFSTCCRNSFTSSSARRRCVARMLFTEQIGYRASCISLTTRSSPSTSVLPLPNEVRDLRHSDLKSRSANRPEMWPCLASEGEPRPSIF